MAGRITVRKDRPPPVERNDIIGLGLQRRPDGDLHPGGQRVEGWTPLQDAVVIDIGIRRIARKADPSLNTAGVVVEVDVAVA
jgi:hypothetical protein